MVVGCVALCILFIKRGAFNLIDKNDFGAGFEEFGAGIPITAQEKFVTRVYSSVDEATAREVERMRSEDGIVPACALGCCHCCWYHILTNIAEAHTLAQYIKRVFTVDQINDLQRRTHQWHEWDGSRPGRHPSASIAGQTDLSNYDHCCPLLVNGACSAYPVRPVVCRTHYVSTHPQYCYSANDPESTDRSPVVLRSVIAVSNQFSTALRDRIESAGLDYTRSNMLLPHWLAVQMKWDFAIEA
jgi:Fe-S-cluster containining protein